MLLLLAIGSFCISFLISWSLNWLALIPWRRSVGQHWTERARLLFPARKSAGLNVWLIPVNLTVLSYCLFSEFHFLAIAIPSFLGALIGNYSMSQKMFPELRFIAWLHLVAVRLFMFFAYWALLLAAIAFMPEDFSALTWFIAGGVLILLLAFLFGLGTYLSHKMRFLKPAPEHLVSLVSEVSKQMNVPVKKIWVLSGPMNNAFALPTTRQLIFTEKMLAVHPDDEIKAICAHELGHLNEPRTILLLRILVASAFFPLIFIRPMDSLDDNKSVIGHLALIAVALVLFFTGTRLSRRMEKRADKIATENQNDTAVYARALERLYQTNLMPATMPSRLNQTHPDLYDRMVAVGVTPDFPRPKPPGGQSWTSYLTLACLVALPIIAGFMKGLITALDASTMQFH